MRPIATSTFERCPVREDTFLNFVNAWLAYHRQSAWALERYDSWLRAVAMHLQGDV
jgi:NAD(P)H-nitrite reductase large subunit